jgi:hypothetical protein
MNVKPGDLAKIINDPRNNGAIVSVLKAASIIAYDGMADWEVLAMSPADGQTIEGDPAHIMPGQVFGALDSNLRRIDAEGEDEMLRIAGIPSVLEVL